MRVQIPVPASNSKAGRVAEVEQTGSIAPALITNSLFEIIAFTEEEQLPFDTVHTNGFEPKDKPETEVSNFEGIFIVIPAMEVVHSPVAPINEGSLADKIAVSAQTNWSVAEAVKGT